MNRNFSFSERVKLEHILNTNTYSNVTRLAKELNKSRSTLYYELKHFTTKEKSKSEIFTANNPKDYCETLKKFPFTCNGCLNTRCSHRSYIYDAYKAQEKADKLLHYSRVNTKRRNDVVKVLDKAISPLIRNGLSIEVALANSKNCDVSASTVRRYIENDLLEVKRIDLPRACRFRSKKEYDYKTPPLDINILYGRTYDDYKKYVEAYPNSKIVQLDSVIGKSNDKKAILTIFFKDSKLQLGRLYKRKNNNVVEIMRNIYKTGKEHGEELFNVILTDNGSEFKSLHNLEFDEDDTQICKVFFCDPYRSCQKAECEKNHGLFRTISPKKVSLDKLEQEDVDEIFSHINSYPRLSLDNKSPIEMFNLEHNPIILTCLSIRKIKTSLIKLKDYRLWKNDNK